LGKIVGTKIPVFVNLPPHLHIECVKGLLYTLTVTGATGLVHLVGITPESPTVEAAFGGSPPSYSDITVAQEDVDKAYSEISSSSEEKVDLVIFGCPQSARKMLSIGSDRWPKKKDRERR